MDGGEVIGSGGYGCVFRPSLKCKSNTKSKRETNNKKMGWFIKLFR